MDLFLKRAEKIFFIVINLIFSSAFIQMESISNFGLFILWTFFQVTYEDFANSGNDIELHVSNVVRIASKKNTCIFR